MADIFISYKREDLDYAKHLADALEGQGWTVWWDPKLRAGERFDDIIDEALRTAGCVIVVWSKLSVESDYVKDEATYALKRNKLVPLATEEVRLPFRFEGIHTPQLCDWYSSEAEPVFQNIVSDIADIIGQPPSIVRDGQRKVSNEQARHEQLVADNADPKAEARYRDAESAPASQVQGPAYPAIRSTDYRWQMIAVAGLVSIAFASLIFVQLNGGGRDNPEEVNSYTVPIPEDIAPLPNLDGKTIETIPDELSTTKKIQDTKEILVQSDVGTTWERGNPDTVIPEYVIESRIEQEPNDDLFIPNVIPLDRLIRGSFSDASDADHYRITTPELYRDIMRIDLENLASTVAPRIGVFNESKKWLGGTSKYKHMVTEGQNQTFSFSASPGAMYYIAVTSLSKGYGDYGLTITPMKAYDGMEPNDDLLHAQVVPTGKTIEANFMDEVDSDYYRIETAARESNITVRFDNLTTTVKPHIGVYDENKKWLGGTSAYSHQITEGQNLSYSFPAAASSVYYIHIDNLSRKAGPYKIVVEEPGKPD